MDKNKRTIIDIFNQNVKGRIPNTDNSSQRHDGREGHWLETQMGIEHNGNNEPDLLRL